MTSAAYLNLQGVDHHISKLQFKTSQTKTMLKLEAYETYELDHYTPFIKSTF